MYFKHFHRFQHNFKTDIKDYLEKNKDNIKSGEIKEIEGLNKFRSSSSEYYYTSKKKCDDIENDINNFFNKNNINIKILRINTEKNCVFYFKEIL